MSDVRWLTYAELGEALHIGRESARQLAKRRRWTRQQGNDGQARVGVPVEDLEARIEARIEAQDEAPDDTPDEPQDDPGVVVLTRHIERLERELEAVKSERDAERANGARLAQQAARIDVLEMLIDVERKHVEEARATAAAVTEKAARVDVLQAELVAERRRAEEWKALAEAPRGWWPWRRRA